MAIVRCENTEILADIWLRASLEAHSFIDAAYWHSNYDDMRLKYLTSAENYAYEDEVSDEITGFISLNGNHIKVLFVDPSHQGRRMGQTLLGYAKNIRERLTLAVYENNARAVKFYVQSGFIVQERRTDLATKEAELVMVWDRRTL